MTKELVDIPDIEVKKVKSTLTQEDVNELFEYRNGDLYWKIDIFTGKNNLVHKVKAGDRAGCIANDKRRNKQYKVVCYGGKIYKISRLIFLMFYNYLPECVTYKDENSLNTKIENLIEANRSQANYRRKVPKTSTSKIKGVRFYKAGKKYRSYITKNGIKNHLGTFNTIEEASRVYNIAREKYYGEFISKCNN